MGYERSSGRSYRDDRSYGPRERDDFRARDRYSSDDRYAADNRYAGRPRDYDDDRGFIDRAGDEVRSWFGDEEAERRRRWDERIRQREEDRYHAERGGRYADDRSGYDRGYAGYGDTGFSNGSYGGGNTYGVGRGAGATSTWGLGAGPSHDGWGQDPNYSNWRRRQLAALDRDYEDYRRENEARFHNDFGSWRTNREGQRQALRQAQEHQEVVGSDGAHIGKVDHVRGDRILLTKGDKDAGGHHHSIPVSWIVEVSDKVRINRTAAQAQAAWKDEESSEGPHYLNHAFPGTY